MLLHGRKGVARSSSWWRQKTSGLVRIEEVWKPQTTESLGQNNQNRLFGLRQLILIEHDPT